MPSSPSYIPSKDSGLMYQLTYKSVCTGRNFDTNHFTYEEWKSVLHLSTRWDFASIRKLALSSIEPPTSHDQLLLARTYSVDNWVVPALSALCERTTPLTLSEARQMSIEDVVLVSAVREDIRGCTLQIDTAEIPPRVEAEQLGALGLEIPLHLRFPKAKGSLPVDLKRAKNDYESDGERSVSPGCSPSWSTNLTKSTGEGRGAGKYWRAERRTSTANEEQSERSSRNVHG